LTASCGPTKTLAAALIAAAMASPAGAAMKTFQQSVAWRVMDGTGECNCDTAVAEIASQDLQGAMAFKYSADRPGHVTILFANNSRQLEVGETVNVVINRTSAGKYTVVTSTAIEAVFATDKDEGPF
jgi:hypothetical protein